MIIIAVSEYKGVYQRLPGVLTCASSLKAWATRTESTYKVLTIWDKPVRGKANPVTADRLERTIKQFLADDIFDRLIVWFGGHGVVRGTDEEFWLLSDIDKDVTEAVHVFGFLRALQTINIGAANPAAITGQLSFLVDCCRTPDVGGHELFGTPIIKSRGNFSDVEIDWFHSSKHGNGAYQVKRNGVPTCLFTDCLVDGISGNVEDAIQRKNHDHCPAVVNHSLSSYLRKEVKARAAKLNVTMKPDIATGISPPDNVYLKIQTGRAKKTGSSLGQTKINVGSHYELWPTSAPNSVEWIDDPTVGNLSLLTARTIIEAGMEDSMVESLPGWKSSDDWRRLGAPSSIDLIGEKTLSILCHFAPDDIALSRGDVALARTRFGWTEIHKVIGRDPVGILRNGRWTLVPRFPDTVSVALEESPSDVLFYERATQTWNTSMSDRMSAVKRHAVDEPIDEADTRPLQAILAAWRFAFRNDYKSVTQIARRMMKTAYGVPFDVALLCGMHVWWIESERFAFAGFTEDQVVPLGGRAPVLAAGWRLFSQIEAVPDNWARLGGFLNGTSVPSFESYYADEFWQALGYDTYAESQSWTASEFSRRFNFGNPSDEESEQ